MKLVVAIIKPFKLEEVRAALSGLGILGMTASDAKGFGRQRGHTETYRGAEYASRMTPKVRLEIACAAGDCARVIETVQQVAHTGAIGDGKIFTIDLGGAIRIRTGESGAQAL